MGRMKLLETKHVLPMCCLEPQRHHGTESIYDVYIVL